MDGISNVGGNVSINNIGAMTVGAAGVNATGGIDLPVASSAGSAANLTLNGVLASAGGNINSLAGNNISVNADVATSAPGLVTLTAVNGVITYAAGVSVSDAHGTVIPVPVVPPAVMPVNPASPADPVAPSPPQTVASLVTLAVTPVSNAVVQAVTSTPAVAATVTPVAAPSGASSSSPTEPMTVGGEPDTFGGADTKTTPEKSGTKSTTKLYCS
ncbi:hypothetical protein [Paraburkholderia saeva]|uniref:hypothetical protein n=1 Tax=Paraburkholderia saeva TaxID=2777537 RepID=UPI001D32532B|nr:hypothetical protein [Paraburkholderia saeva]CAG4889039.1 hypothetical protein R52603_00849 [Paraburkholderia saeva]